MQPYVVPKYEDADLPPLDPDTSRIVAAANGLFRERDNGMFRSSTQVEPTDLGLAEHFQYCQLRCGRLPRVMQRAMLSFFRAAHALHGGEVALVLLYHPERKRFRWHCPRQRVNLHWINNRWIASEFITFSNPTVLPEGYLHFGDSHLHTGSNTTPSYTDVSDDQDGLHMIVGNIQARPRYHIDFVLDGKRFRVAPELLFDDPRCLPGIHAPPVWLDQVQIERYIPYQRQDAQPYDEHEHRSRQGGWQNNNDPWSSGNGDSQA